jgi:hypothetical protein
MAASTNIPTATIASVTKNCFAFSSGGVPYIIIAALPSTDKATGMLISIFVMAAAAGGGVTVVVVVTIVVVVDVVVVPTSTETLTSARTGYAIKNRDNSSKAA